MGFLSNWFGALNSQKPDGLGELHIGDPRFDDWEVVRELADVKTARAWLQQLADHGIEAVITADHPPDRFGHGDIYLQVPPDRWSDAEELFSGL